MSPGRAYLANPDLVERLRRRLPLAEADPTTYCTGGDAGFLDVPVRHQVA
ncbi:hypothetical protein [Nocardioides sp. YR527]|nr:hypothetical protein [Nocardioides sp. YR527]